MRLCPVLGNTRISLIKLISMSSLLLTRMLHDTQNSWELCQSLRLEQPGTLPATPLRTLTQNTASHSASSGRTHQPACCCSGDVQRFGFSSSYINWHWWGAVLRSIIWYWTGIYINFFGFSSYWVSRSFQLKRTSTVFVSPVGHFVLINVLSRSILVLKLIFVFFLSSGCGL